MPFISTSEAKKRSSARTENGNFERSRTVEVVKASQPPFTLSLLTLFKASERRGLLEDTGLEDKCFWVLFAAGEIAWNLQGRHPTHCEVVTHMRVTRHRRHWHFDIWHPWSVIFLKVGGMRFLKQCLQALLPAPSYLFTGPRSSRAGFSIDPTDREQEPTWNRLV